MSMTACGSTCCPNGAEGEEWVELAGLSSVVHAHRRLLFTADFSALLVPLRSVVASGGGRGGFADLAPRGCQYAAALRLARVCVGDRAAAGTRQAASGGCRVVCGRLRGSGAGWVAVFVCAAAGVVWKRLCVRLPFPECLTTPPCTFPPT